MEDYLFKTQEFGLNVKGVHFLRKGYNYQTVDFSQINYAEIRKGKELKNWFIIFLIGIMLSVVGAVISIPVIEAFIDGGLRGQQVRVALLLFIPAVGGYFVYSSLRTGTILEINYSEDKKFRFPLSSILKAKKMTGFKSFLADKLKGKLKEG